MSMHLTASDQMIAMPTSLLDLAHQLGDIRDALLDEFGQQQLGEYAHNLAALVMAADR